MGIDPVYERLPETIRRDPRYAPGSARGGGEAFVEYGVGVLDAVAEHTPCVKIQSACFERYLWPGVEAYHRLIVAAKERGLIVIGDAKRGDISISAEHYAMGCLADTHFNDLGDLPGPEALTINPYLGADSIEPFMGIAAEQGKGLFALVRTSNPGSDALQNLPLDSNQTVAQAVASIVAGVGSQSPYIGKSGYSLLGAVVGATKVNDITALRERMPQQLFLVPGFGAQGGSTQDIKACFKPDGTGAIITASRSVIYAYEKTGDDNWQRAVEQAAIKFKQQVASVL